MTGSFLRFPSKWKNVLSPSSSWSWTASHGRNEQQNNDNQADADAVRADSLCNSPTTGGPAYDRFALRTNGSYDYKFSIEDLETDDSEYDDDDDDDDDDNTEMTTMTATSNRTAYGGRSSSRIVRNISAVLGSMFQPRNGSQNNIDEHLPELQREVVNTNRRTGSSGGSGKKKTKKKSTNDPTPTKPPPPPSTSTTGGTALQDRRQRTQNLALLALGMFSVVMFVGLMPLSARKRKNSNAGYVTDAFRPLGNEHMITCQPNPDSSNNDNPKTKKITFEEWIQQDASSNIDQLCDPIFMKLEQYADPSQVVKVFILMGEANTVGTGTIHGPSDDGTLEHTAWEKNRFIHVRDPDAADGTAGADADANTSNSWSVRKDVRYVHVQNDFEIIDNKWLQVDDTRDFFGMEAQLGYILGEVLEEPILLLKVAAGHNSLGGDLLPPNSPRYEMNGFVYAGTGESPRRWDVGTAPVANNWKAGSAYDQYVRNARRVLHDLGTFYPGASNYEISGIVWWQGDSDRRVDAYAAKYESNLVRLINSLRFDLRAPRSKFVVASIGQNGNDMKGGSLQVWEAQHSVSNYQKYPEYEDNVATVDTRSSWKGPYLPGHPRDSGYLNAPHYGNNAETQLEVGNAVGLKMVQLLALD